MKVEDGENKICMNMHKAICREAVSLAIEKILASGLWTISDEKGRLFQCSPIISKPTGNLE